MGIDFGTKKVGIALSDESGKMAFPHSVIKNDPALLKAVVALIEQEAVGEIVMGHSVDTDGVENKVHQYAVDFIANLTLQIPIPVHFEPEQYSTQQAIKMQGKNDQVDASAAAIILESYLSKQTEGSVFDELDN